MIGYRVDTWQGGFRHRKHQPIASQVLDLPWSRNRERIATAVAFAVYRTRKVSPRFWTPLIFRAPSRDLTLRRDQPLRPHHGSKKGKRNPKNSFFTFHSEESWRKSRAGEALEVRGWDAQEDKKKSCRNTNTVIFCPVVTTFHPY